MLFHTFFLVVSCALTSGLNVDNKTGHQSSESVQIQFDQDTNAEFPSEFKVKVSSLNTINFAQIEKGDSYPLGSGQVFTVNGDGEVVEFGEKSERGYVRRDFELYREVDGNSIATLIRNEGFQPGGNDHPFRMVCYL